MRPRVFRSTIDNITFGTRTKIAAVIFLATISCWGCAKIAEPEPPQVRIPKPAVDLAVRQRSDYLVITVSKPESNTNGSEATTLKRVDVYRLSQGIQDTEGALPEEQFIRSASRILSIPSSRFPEYLRDKVFVFQDDFPPEKSIMYSGRFQYAALFINNKNQSAGLSNRASITPVPIPLPPADITVQGTQDSIRLQWTAPSENMDGSKPPRTAGYNIYRSEVPNTLASTPINPSPVPIPEFVDSSFRFDATYYYVITTVGSLQQPCPESLPSSAVSIAAKDIFPPAPPSDFSAIMQADTVILLWAPSPSTDLAGYRLYKKEKGAMDRQLIQSDLIRAMSFRDNRVDPGKTYEYEIEAVDTHGNASETVKTESEQR
jgi:hypothetical protein